MMFDDLTPDACYQAMKSHDARFDGHFFVGVRSTGIYCRPICRVRLPKQANCSFHRNAAAAEVAGFRPCLRCRPELAPGVGASEASPRRSNALMAQRANCASSLRFLLPYRPPFDFTALLAFLRDRAIPGIESVDEQCYRRTVPIEKSGWIEVRHCPARNALELRCDAAFAGVTQAILTRTKQAFDLGADPIEIDAVLGPLAASSPGMRLPGTLDPFELAVRAILGQQVTVKAARTLATRFVAALGTPISTPFTELNRVFPQVVQIASLNPTTIAALGIVRQRAEAIVALADAIAAGAIDFRPTAEPTQTIERLCRIRGIGPWTAHYIAMRALAWPDAWLPNDIALQNALGLPNTAAGVRTAQALANVWRPWRSYAVLHLWRGPLQ